MELIELDSTDLVLALGIMGIAIVLSGWQNLNLEGQLFFAAVRSLLQLLAVGYILALVFALDNPMAILLILGVMLTIATITARNRISKKLKGLLPIIFVSLLASSFLTLGYSLILIIQPPNWYDPQYLIPLTGMILGNAMNAAALAGERLTSMISHHQGEIETYLCLGASPQQAISSYRKEAIRASLIPILNQMVVVGIVSLPGMFTGQVLAGSNPLDAACYQILILFMITLTNLVSVLLTTEGIYRQFFNRDEQLIII